MNKTLFELLTIINEQDYHNSEWNVLHIQESTLTHEALGTVENGHILEPGYYIIISLDRDDNLLLSLIINYKEALYRIEPWTTFDHSEVILVFKVD